MERGWEVRGFKGRAEGMGMIRGRKGRWEAQQRNREQTEAAGGDVNGRREKKEI